MEAAGVFSQYRLRVRISPCPQGKAWLAPESKDALDISSEATLGLLLQLVLKRWESHMVEGQVKEQRLAWDGLESRREVHEVGLLGDEGRVQAECLKPFDQGLEVKPKARTQMLITAHWWNIHYGPSTQFRAHMCYLTRSPQTSYEGLSCPRFIIESH